jgi:uncharacterized protein YyaL (SSP411 family)
VDINKKTKKSSAYKEPLDAEHAFVCKDFSCSLPLVSLEQLQKHLGKDDDEIGS